MAWTSGLDVLMDDSITLLYSDLIMEELTFIRKAPYNQETTESCNKILITLTVLLYAIIDGDGL